MMMSPAQDRALPVTKAVLSDPVVSLAALCPICALAALSPSAALAALSPALAIFNPALNPAAALLAFLLPQQQMAGRVQAQLQGRLYSLRQKNGVRRFR